MAEIKRIPAGWLIALGVLAVISAWISWFSLMSAKHDLENSRITPQAAEELTAFSTYSLFFFLFCLIGFVLLWGFFHIPLGYMAVRPKAKPYTAGWQYHLLLPLLSLELIELKSRNLKVPPFPIRSRSQAEFDMHVAVNWRPDPENIQAYIQHGREAAGETLSHIVTNRLTKWAYNAGPEDWRDAFGAHDLSKEALVDELTHTPSNVALVPAAANLMVPGDIATYQYRPLGIVIGGVYVNHIEPRKGSRFSARDLMLEANYDLPFEKQLERAIKDIEDIDKLEKQRKQLLLKFKDREAEINRKFNMLKDILFDK